MRVGDEEGVFFFQEADGIRRFFLFPGLVDVDYKKVVVVVVVVVVEVVVVVTHFAGY